jgi:hypothetical protein
MVDNQLALLKMPRTIALGVIVTIGHTPMLRLLRVLSSPLHQFLSEKDDDEDQNDDESA